MAVFLLNVCKFNECGIQFPNLTDLIHHIEATHIDYDPKVVEQKELQQPACLPLSYVLRFITDATRKEPVPSPISSTGCALNVSPLNGVSISSSAATANGQLLSTTNGSQGITNGGGTGGGVGAATTAELKRKLAIKHHSYSISSSNRSNTPTGSEMDEEEMMLSQSEDSNDSWTTEEFSSEFIMRYGSRHSGGTGPNGSNEKPFACPVPGCKKRYKNVNGIKYHSKNGHKKDGKVRKGYKCHCGKSYKTAHGLKNHSVQVHNTDNIQLTQVPMGGSQNGGGGGTPIVINQAIAPSPRSSMSPTGHHNGSSGGGNHGSSNQAAANSSTVQLSPASSISSLSSSNGVSSSAAAAVALPMNGGGGASVSPPSSNSSSSSSSSMKSNYGLITIKGKSNNILATRCVKLLTTTAQQQQGGSPPTAMSVDDNRLDLNGGMRSQGMLQHSSSASAVVNLGILTPATSPRNNGSQQQQQHQMTTSMNGGGGSSTSSGCSSMESLPLTPVSPTIGKSEAFVGVAQDLISASGGVGNSVMAQVSALMNAAQMVTGGDSDDHNMSDDT